MKKKSTPLLIICLIIWNLLFIHLTSELASAKFPETRTTLPSDVAQYVETILPSQPGDTFVELKNGLTILVRKRTGSPVVSCQVFVHAGSIYEGPYFLSGISHYLEHVVAGGTTRDFTEEEAQKEIQKMGGASNAYTSYNKTVYFINTTSQYSSEALKLLLSYVGHCAFDPKEVAREKGVIQQEFKLGENNPSRQLWRLFMKTAYLVHPIRQPVIGYEKVFVTITRDDLMQYYKSRYLPNNMVVSVVGNIQPLEVIRRISEITKDFSRKSSNPFCLPREPRQLLPRRAEKVSPMARLTRMIVGYPSVSLNDPDLYPLDVLAMIIGRGRSSRLYQSLRDKHDVVLSVNASNWTPSFARGIFMISMSLPGKNVDRSISLLQEEIKRLQEESVTREELERAKQQVAADRLFSNESVESMASSLASSYLETGDPYFDEKYVENIQKVRQKDVKRVARKYLRANAMDVSILRPQQKMTGKKVATESQERASEPASKIEKVVFPNGLIVLLKENHEVPVFTIQMFGRGGLCYEPENFPGISNFTFLLLTKGTRNKTMEEIANIVEGMGARLSSGSGKNSFYVTSSALSKDFDKILKIFSDVVRNPNFPENEIEKQRRDVLLTIKKLDESWQSEIIRFFKRQYYHEHPYKNDVVGTTESIRAITRDEIEEFYHSLVMPNNAVIAIFGDIDRAKTLNLLQKYFGKWQKGTLPLLNLPDESQPLKKSVTFKKKNEKISAAVFLGTNGTTIDSDDKPVLDVIDAVISGIGYPSGWLQDALRGGKQNLVYLVHAFPFSGIKAGYFGVITQTTMMNLEKVLKIINQKLDRISRKPIGDEELEKGKDMVITMYRMGLETNEEQAQDAALNEILGLGYNYGNVYVEKIKNVTAYQVLHVAKKYFKNRLTVITIPEKPVETVIPKGKRVQSDIR